MDRKYSIVGSNEALAVAANIAAGYDEESLIAASNKGTFKRAVKDAEGYGSMSIITECGVVIGQLPEAKVFMGKDIGKCTCSCPSKTVCRHIIAAAVMMRELAVDAPKEDNAPVKEDNAPAAVEKPEGEQLSADRDYLGQVMSAVQGIIRKGIISCGMNDAELLSRLSLSAPAVHKEIGKMLRGAAEDIELCLDRSGGFSPAAASARLCRIYNMAEASMNNSGLLNTGNEYKNEGSGEFICIGVYPHRSRSGFAGVTAVMFEVNRGKYYTYSTGVSDIYSKTENAGSLASLTKQAKAHSHWMDDVSLKMISGHRVVLSGLKADKSGRISSSKQTACVIKPPISSADMPEAAEVMSAEGEYDYFDPEKKPRFAAVKADMINEVRFDSGEQMIHYTIVSGNEHYHCEEKWSELSEYAYEYLRRMEGRELMTTYMLIRVYGGQCRAVSLISLSGVMNFYFKEEI